jgi:homoaconitase/3-isopropylmalate dehydratase large subunit
MSPIMAAYTAINGTVGDPLWNQIVMD